MGLKVGQDASFTVQLNGARGLIDAKIHTPSGATEECHITEVDGGKVLDHWLSNWTRYKMKSGDWRLKQGATKFLLCQAKWIYCLEKAKKTITMQMIHLYTTVDPDYLVAKSELKPRRSISHTELEVVQTDLTDRFHIFR